MALGQHDSSLPDPAALATRVEELCELARYIEVCDNPFSAHLHVSSHEDEHRALLAYGDALVPALAIVLGRGGAEVRAQAARLLAALPASQAVMDAAAPLLNDPSTSVASGAWVAAFAFDAEHATQAAQKLYGARPDLQADLARWLRAGGTTSALSLLTSLAGDGAPEVRRDAIAGLHRLSRDHARDVLLDLYLSASTPDARVDALAGLAGLTWRQTLGTYAGAFEEVGAPLVPALEGIPRPELRELLGYLGSAEPARVRPALLGPRASFAGAAGRALLGALGCTLPPPTLRRQRVARR